MELAIMFIASMLTDIGLVVIVYVIAWFLVKKFKAERKFSLTFVLTLLISLIIALAMNSNFLDIITLLLDLLIVSGVSFLLRDKESSLESEVKG